MKYIIIAMAFLTLTSCGFFEDSKEIVIDKKELPEGLKDCRVFKVNPSAISRNIIVFRCANSTTTSYEINETGKSKGGHENVVSSQ